MNPNCTCGHSWVEHKMVWFPYITSFGPCGFPSEKHDIKKGHPPCRCAAFKVVEPPKPPPPPLTPVDKLAAWQAAYALERQHIESKWDDAWEGRWEYLYEREYLFPFWKNGYWFSITAAERGDG